MTAIVFQCPSCRALVGAERAEVQPGRAGLHCSACGAVAWLPDGTERAEARVVDVEPATRAPARRELPAPGGALVVAPPSAPVTAAQGGRLDDERVVRWRERVAALPAPAESQRALAAAFDQLLGAWGTDAQHKALLKRASSEGELAFLGQRYRAVLDVSPEDTAARRAQSEILSLAMAAMSATRDLGALATDPAATARRRTLLMSAILLVFAGIILWALRERNALLRDGDDGAKMMAEDPAAEGVR